MVMMILDWLSANKQVAVRQLGIKADHGALSGKDRTFGQRDRQSAFGQIVRRSDHADPDRLQARLLDAFFQVKIESPAAALLQSYAQA